MLQTGVYSNEYIDDWEKFNGASLTEKDFYSNLNMEEVRADADYLLTKTFVKILNKKLGEFYDLHAQNNTLLLRYLITFEICFLKYMC